MFRFLRKKAKTLKRAAGRAFTGKTAGQNDSLPLSRSLDDSLERIKAMLGEGNDIVYHRFSLGSPAPDAAVIYIDGMVNQAFIANSILTPVLFGAQLKNTQNIDIKVIKSKLVTASEIEEIGSVYEAVGGCLSGNTVLLVDGSGEALSIGTKGWDKRNVAEPESETTVRGSREGFTENLRTNMTLIRRRICTHDLRVESMTIGERTRTNICIAYIRGIADPNVLQMLRERLSGIHVDAILDSGYIEEYIEDNPFSIFGTISYSEKPDVVAGRVLEGRIAIVVDGSPFVLCVPMLFAESFQTSEDYYIRFLPATVNRLIRYAAFFISVYTPSIYIALTSFHQELLPPKLLFSIIGARIGTPFPAIVEILILLFAFEMLREAGLRLPRPVGQAISIVGALILGDAAVSAGLVGATAVIIVALTELSAYIVPSQVDAAIILRLITLMLTSVLGILGMLLGMCGFLIHLASLKSFGVYYFNGFFATGDIKDSFFRAPLWLNNTRPRDIARGDVIRGRFFIPPFQPHRRREDDE